MIHAGLLLGNLGNWSPYFPEERFDLISFFIEFLFIVLYEFVIDGINLLRIAFFGCQRPPFPFAP